MTKEELKKLLQDNLEISIDAGAEGPWGNTLVKVKITFAGEEVCKDATIIVHK